MYHNAYLRNNIALHHMFYERMICKEHLIMPYLIIEEHRARRYDESHSAKVYTQKEVHSMLEDYVPKGLSAILLCTCTDENDSNIVRVFDRNAYCIDVIREIKDKYPSLLVIVDITRWLCDCNGYFGIERNGDINIDATVDILTEIAVLCAKAGADILLHSGMIHSLTKAIKKTLQSHSIYHVAVMSYAMQIEDIFCGTLVFSREMMKTAISQEHYMSVAIHEKKSGVDVMVVSPLGFALDAIHAVTQEIDVPVFAFHTYREYLMLQYAIENALLSQADAFSLLYYSAMRAGAKAIITPYTTTLLSI